MSFQAMTWAVEQDLPMKEKMVLLMLANHANGHSGRCDPSLARLAKECGASKATVIRAIKVLNDKGLVKTVQRFWDGAQINNSYILLMPQVDAACDGIELVEMRGVVAHSNRGGCSQQRGVVADSNPKQEVKPRKETKDTIASPDGFAAFWQEYPKKVGKQNALKEWKKLNPDADLQRVMLTALKAQKATDQWKAGFVKDPERWIKGRRWEDEILSAEQIEKAARDAERAKLFRGAR